MRRFMWAVLMCGGFCVMPSWVFAGTLSVASAGLFSGSVPTTTWSAPSTSWSFSFNISDTPVVSNETAGVAFDVPFSSFTYFLGGMSVAAPTTEFRIRFFVTDANGLLSVILQDTTTPPNGDPQVGFVFHGAQAFSGTTNSPTILANSYAASSGTFYSGGQPRDDLSGVIVDVTPVGSVLPEVPEPANLGIIAGACCLLITIRYRRRVN